MADDRHREENRPSPISLHLQVMAFLSSSLEHTFSWFPSKNHTHHLFWQTSSDVQHILSSRTFQSLKTLSISSFSKVWLIKVVESYYGQLCLLDPFTNRRLNEYSHYDTRYPSHSFHEGAESIEFRFIEVIKALSVSLNGYDGTRPPPQDGKVVVFPSFAWTKVENRMFFSVHRDGKLGFSKIGDDEWTLVDDKNVHYDDIIVHEGQLYVVDRWGTISSIDYSSLTLVQFSPPLCGLGKKYKKHLVGSCGSLYAVDMYFVGDPNQPKGACYDVVDLKVYKLDEEWGRWLDVKNLDEHAFVLGKDCHFSLSARDYHGFEEDCIYFCNRGIASMFNLETSTFKSAKVFWPCQTLFDLCIKKRKRNRVILN